MKLTTNYKEIENIEKKGIELYFDNIPTYAERTELKANGYRWNVQKKCWYIRKDKLNTTRTTKSNSTKKAVKNEFGVKVGDIFVMSWGYEQTNTTFFRVEKLRGTKQVVIKEVYLKIQTDDAVSGMSADRTYDTNNYTYKDCDRSLFIKNEDGDIKTIKNFKADGYEPEPLINFDYANAYLYKGEKLYESWYY